MGLGLATSRILSQKHGGSLELSNIAPSGACVTIKLAVHKANYAVRMYQKTGFEIVDENGEEYIMLRRV